MQYEILRGDCIAAMRAMPANSIDSIVTDPPYELGFMGKAWDASGIAYSVEMWREALRVLKPGGHLLAFSGSRTYHRMTCAIEDAGFEVRDQIMWVYGSGFPKSLDVSKAIDKTRRRDYVLAAVEMGLSIPGNNLHDWTKADHAPGDKWWSEFKAVLSPEQWGALERAVIGYSQGRSSAIHGGGQSVGTLDAITAPATDAARQWEGWGTALKPAHEPICVARKPLVGTVAANVLTHGTGAINIDGCRVGAEGGTRKGPSDDKSVTDSVGGYLNAKAGELVDGLGRWPANLIHDGSDEVLALFPGEAEGSAARFFYCAKASKSDRGPGNTHPTVKPLALMQYLCRLVTPPGGHVLDPFAGSGSTVVAALREGFRVTGIELLDDHADIIEGRIEHEFFGDIL